MNPVRAAGARLMLERQLRGWSQYEAASRAGINQSVVSRIENGLEGVTYAAVARYAQALGLSVLPHHLDGGDMLLTSGRLGAYRELVTHLETLRLATGDSQVAAGLRAGRGRFWWKKFYEMSGPAFDTVNEGAAAYGYRLALVPIEEVECGWSEEVGDSGGGVGDSPAGDPVRH